MNNKKRSCCQGLKDLMQAKFFKALSDPNRIALVAEVAASPQAINVGQACGCCAVDLSVVSRHLAQLKDAEILKSQRLGKEVYYSINTEDLVKNLRALADALEGCCPKPKKKGVKKK